MCWKVLWSLGSTKIMLTHSTWSEIQCLAKRQSWWKKLVLKKKLHIFANFGQCQPPWLLQLRQKWDPSMLDPWVQHEGPQSHHHEDLGLEVQLLCHVQLQHLLSHYWGHGCSWGLKICNIRVLYGIITPSKNKVNRYYLAGLMHDSFRQPGF